MDLVKGHVIALYVLLFPLAVTHGIIGYNIYLQHTINRELNRKPKPQLNDPLGPLIDRQQSLFVKMVYLHLVGAVVGTILWAVLSLTKKWHWSLILLAAWPIAISMLREVSKFLFQLSIRGGAKSTLVSLVIFYGRTFARLVFYMALDGSISRII